MFRRSRWPCLRGGLSVGDRESPGFTRVNGPLMARRLDHVEGGLPPSGAYPKSPRRFTRSVTRHPRASANPWPPTGPSPRQMGVCCRSGSWLWCSRGSWRRSLAAAALSWLGDTTLRQARTGRPPLADRSLAGRRTRVSLPPAFRDKRARPLGASASPARQPSPRTPGSASLCPRLSPHGPVTVRPSRPRRLNGALRRRTPTHTPYRYQPMAMLELTAMLARDSCCRRNPRVRPRPTAHRSTRPARNGRCLSRRST